MLQNDKQNFDFFNLDVPELALVRLHGTRVQRTSQGFRVTATVVHPQRGIRMFSGVGASVQEAASECAQRIILALDLGS